VDAAIPELARALRTGTSAVLQAPPGAGKTTRVPLMLLDEPWLAGQRIIMLEPRRLATRAVARHMASLLGEKPGETIGYRVRRDTRVGLRTRIEVVTEGILTRMLQSDPTLEGTGLVIFDEFHERSVHADLGLALTLYSRALVRPELRVLVMSATLDGAGVARLLNDAPVVTSEGRAYPVEIHYTEHAASRATPRAIDAAVVSHIQQALREHDGDILTFLPGGGEIRRVAARLAESGLPAQVVVTPLYGDLPQQAQDAAIAPAPDGIRKVVLSTPIAETSLTIEGVRVVIDSGLTRVPRFAPRTGMTRLETVRVSRSSADQRCGRAGRVGPGQCYRMWPAHEQHHLLPHTTPEILQADLAPLVLDLALAGIVNASDLQWLDAPPTAAYEQARSLLMALNAVDGEGRITAHGRAMTALPVHPRIAHMLLRAIPLGAGALACDIAALLSERDIMRGDGGPPDADVQLRLDAIQTAQRHDRHMPHADVDAAAARRVAAESDALRRQLHVNKAADDDQNAGLVLAFAYPDRIGQRRGEAGSGRFLLRNGSGVALSHPQGLTASEYIVAADLGGDARDARIFLGAELTMHDIEAHFANQIVVNDVVAWDDASERVVARRRVMLGAIVLRETRIAEPDSAVVTGMLLDQIRRQGPSLLPWSDAARQTRERMAFMHAQDVSWPDVSDAALMTTADEWLTPELQGVSSLDDLRVADLAGALEGLLSWQQRAELHRRAPTHYTTPAGTRVRIGYSDPAAPFIAVRLQEMFGERVTPTVNDGRVALTVQLLSPARRPVQVTRDLAGFWRGSYFDVRKELRGRYPKHAWPDDPLTASPTRRTVRKPAT
jgi:ATP-dependent helicase HrpB